MSPNISVAISGSNYVISDSNSLIELDSNAIGAGWTGNGTHTVTGPTSGVNTIAFQTASGSSVSIGGIAGGSANISFVGSGTTSSLTINGSVTTTGNLAFSGYNSVVDATGTLTASTVSLTGTGNITFTNAFHVQGNLAISGYTTVDLENNVTATGSVTVSGVTNFTDGGAASPTPGTLTGTTLNLTTTGEIGTSTSPLLTVGATIIANAGAGSVYISQTGSSNFSGSVTARAP